MEPETIKIVSDETELGYQIINLADFDKSTMKKYKEPAAKADSATDPAKTEQQQP